MTEQRQKMPIVAWVMLSVIVGMLAGFVMFVVFALPTTVNAVAYLVGAGGQSTFTASSSNYSCSPYDSYGDTTCSWTTFGYINPGHIPASWPGQAMGTFTVRTPVWDWAPFSSVSVFDQGSAIFYAVCFGSIQLALAGALFFGAHRGYRAWRSGKRGRSRDRPAPA